MLSITNISTILLGALLCTTNTVYSVQSTLHNLVKTGESDDLREHLKSNPGYLYRLDSAHNTLLHTAVVHRQSALVFELVERGPFMVDVQNIDGKTPLHLAVSLGDLDMVRLLCSKTFQPLVQEDYQKCTPLALAYLLGHWKIFSFLYTKMFSIVLKSLSLSSMSYAEHQVASSLARYKPFLERWTPLHVACAQGNISMIIHYISEQKGDLYEHNTQGYLPLDLVPLHLRKYIESYVCHYVSLQRHDKN